MHHDLQNLRIFQISFIGISITFGVAFLLRNFCVVKGNKYSINTKFKFVYLSKKNSRLVLFKFFIF